MSKQSTAKKTTSTKTIPARIRYTKYNCPDMKVGQQFFVSFSLYNKIGTEADFKTIHNSIFKRAKEKKYKLSGKTVYVRGNLGILFTRIS